MPSSRDMPENPTAYRVIAEVRGTRDDELIATIHVGDEAQPITLEVNPTLDEKEGSWRATVGRLIRQLNARVKQSGCFESFDGKSILVRHPEDLHVVQEIERLVQRIGVGMAKVVVLE